MEEKIAFRKSKSHKFARRKSEDIKEDPDASVELKESGIQTYCAVEQPQEVETVIAKFALKSKLSKSSREGVFFSNIRSNSFNATSHDESEKRDDPPTAQYDMKDRFTTQTLQRSDLLDKHMAAYIEDHLTAAEATHFVSGEDGKQGRDWRDSEIFTKVRGQSSRQPASLGKIQEIDLGPGSTLSNIERTKAATRKLTGQSSHPDFGLTDTNVPLPGRTGKPRRLRRRRNSEDLVRDRLVEEVLRESKLDLYEDDANKGPNGDEAADDRIAEEFRKEFMDAISSRNHKRAAIANQAASKKKTRSEEKPRGPKLGGSRSARAAMRARESNNSGNK